VRRRNRKEDKRVKRSVEIEEKRSEKAVNVPLFK
jgi:hypothetical protein